MADLAHRREFAKCFGAVRKADEVDGLVRNACIALGILACARENRATKKFRPLAQLPLRDAMVAEHAQWALHGSNLCQDSTGSRATVVPPASSDRMRMAAAGCVSFNCTEEAPMAQQQAATPQKEGPWPTFFPAPLRTRCVGALIDKLTMEIHHGKHHNAYVTT